MQSRTVTVIEVMGIAALHPFYGLDRGPEGGSATEFCKLRDDAIVPVICPTCQMFFAGHSKNTPAGDAMLLCMGLFSIF
jgi:hypothetical protein